MTTNDLFTTSDANKKNLARNVPADFTAYLKQVERTLPYSNHRSAWRRNELNSIAKLLMDDPTKDFTEYLLSRFGETWVRYEALNRSVDFQVTPAPVHKALDSAANSLKRIATKSLANDIRDQMVAEDRGLLDISEYELGTMDLEDAGTLAEKVTFARLKLLEYADEIKRYRDHFVYKGSLTKPGKPGAYSMYYAVFALGDLFMTHNEFGDKASVNTFTHEYSGRFIHFVRKFFKTANEAIYYQSGSTFPENVRKIAQKRSADPDCYKLLDGEASTQDLLDFMARIDAVR